jgi:hypothetical protein
MTYDPRLDAVIVAAAALAAILPIILFAYQVAGVRLRSRFSLLNLFIAMTLAAAVLGLMAALR